MQQSTGIEKNFTIDILKCLAALLITNSHLDPLYGPFAILGTGGAIGDILFFFCSGFTLFLGRNDSFGNWYKRRVNRIYPSVIMALLFLSALFGRCITWQDVIFVLWAWFIPCIMVYYFILYFIRRYIPNKIGFVFAFVILLTILLFLIDPRRESLFIYLPGFFKCVPFFLFMLIGAVVGRGQSSLSFFRNRSLSIQLLLLIISITFFYGFMYIGKFNSFLYNFQLLSLIPLCAISILLYEIFSRKPITSFLQKGFVGYFIRLTSALTLEIYFMNELITTRFNSLFPLNVLIMLAIIYGMAYLLKACSTLFMQTFQEGEYNWRKIIRFV